MKKNGAVSSSVLGIIIFAAVFLLLRNYGCSSCSSSCAGCIACNAYSCVSGCASGAGGRAASQDSCAPQQSNNGQGGASLAQKDNIYVNDYADVVDDNARQSIIRLGSQLEDETGAQLAVVVINNSELLGNDDIKNYTYKLFNDWGVGSKEKNDGVLLVINTAEGAQYTGNAWCVIGAGLEKLLPASDVGEIIDTEVLPCLDRGLFSDAALKGYTALYQKLSNVLGG